MDSKRKSVASKTLTYFSSEWPAWPAQSMLRELSRLSYPSMWISVMCSDKFCAKININVHFTSLIRFLLQRVSIACYAERCINHSKSVRPSVCLSVRPSVRHTLALSQNNTSYDHGVFTGGYSPMTLHRGPLKKVPLLFFTISLAIAGA